MAYQPPVRERVTLWVLADLAMEVARGAALAMGAVVGTGVGVMMLDWLV